MLFRSCAVILIAGSVLAAGCRAPSVRKTTSSASAPVKPATALVRSHNDGVDDTISLFDASRDAGMVDNSNVIEAHARYASGVAHEMNLEAEEALDDYYKAALLDPANEGLVLEIAQQFLQVKRPQKALDLLTHAATNSDPSSALFAELGFVYSKLGKTNEAFKADRAAIRKNPRSLAGYQSLYLDYLQNRQTNQLSALLEEAAKVKGTDAEFLIGLAELYFHLGNDVEKHSSSSDSAPGDVDAQPSEKSVTGTRALAVLQRASKMKITELRLQLRLADGFSALGRTEEAARVYERIIKQLPDASPQYDSVHAKLADIYLHDHDSKRAGEQLKIILRNNPTDPQTYYLLGGLAYDETNYTEAADYFRNAILFNPDFEPAYYNLATSQLGADKAPDALETLNRARRRFPQSFLAEYLSGVAYTRQKEYTNALQHFTTAEVVAKGNDPKRLNDAFYFQLAATYERVGDYLQAEKYFESCLKLAPDSVEALNYLGYMWAEHDRKLDQAHDLIAKALKADPKNAAFLDSMAWVLFKLHQPKPALDYALKAIQYSEEEDSTVYDHLGDIYAALGQNDKARQAWTKSLSLEANDSVRKKLDSGHK